MLSFSGEVPIYLPWWSSPAEEHVCIHRINFFVCAYLSNCCSLELLDTMFYLFVIHMDAWRFLIYNKNIKMTRWYVRIDLSNCHSWPWVLMDILLIDWVDPEKMVNCMHVASVGMWGEALWRDFVDDLTISLLTWSLRLCDLLHRCGGTWMA